MAVRDEPDRIPGTTCLDVGIVAGAAALITGILRRRPVHGGIARNCSRSLVSVLGPLLRLRLRLLRVWGVPFLQY